MRKRGGFTLIELLVVVGIVIALAALILPALHRAYIVAERTRMAADIQVIGEALEAYRSDFGSYPQTGPFPNQRATLNPILLSGPQALCAALIAPGPKEEDGADGPGFRLRGTTGRVYGPYLPADRFMIGTMGKGDDVGSVLPFPENGTSGIHDWFYVLADRRGHVILYYPRHANKPGKGPYSYVGAYTPIKFFTGVGVFLIPPGWGVDSSAHFDPNNNIQPMWSVLDGPSKPIIISAMLLRAMLGADASGAATSDATATDASYLLISAATADAVARWYPVAPVIGGPTYASAPHGMQNPFGSDENVANVPILNVDPNLTPDREDRRYVTRH